MRSPSPTQSSPRSLSMTFTKLWRQRGTRCSNVASGGEVSNNSAVCPPLPCPRYGGGIATGSSLHEDTHAARDAGAECGCSMGEKSCAGTHLTTRCAPQQDNWGYVLMAKLSLFLQDRPEGARVLRPWRWRSLKQRSMPASFVQWSQLHEKSNCWGSLQSATEGNPEYAKGKAGSLAQWTFNSSNHQTHWKLKAKLGAQTHAPAPQHLRTCGRAERSTRSWCTWFESHNTRKLSHAVTSASPALGRLPATCVFNDQILRI